MHKFIDDEPPSQPCSHDGRTYSIPYAKVAEFDDWREQDYKRRSRWWTMKLKPYNSATDPFRKYMSKRSKRR